MQGSLAIANLAVADDELVEGFEFFIALHCRQILAFLLPPILATKLLKSLRARIILPYLRITRKRDALIQPSAYIILLRCYSIKPIVLQTSVFQELCPVNSIEDRNLVFVLF